MSFLLHALTLVWEPRINAAMSVHGETLDTMYHIFFPVCSYLFIYLYFKVRGREPAVTHWTVCAASSPGNTDLYDVQPNPADLHLYYGFGCEERQARHAWLVA